MPTFGRFDRGDRSAPRAKAGLVAVLSNGSDKYSSILLDISRTGVRLRGPRLPLEGEDVLLLTEHVRVWGQVVRLDGDVCAVEFDNPIAPEEVKQLESFSSAPPDQFTP